MGRLPVKWAGKHNHTRCTRWANNERHGWKTIIQHMLSVHIKTRIWGDSDRIEQVSHESQCFPVFVGTPWLLCPWILGSNQASLVQQMRHQSLMLVGTYACVYHASSLWPLFQKSSPFCPISRRQESAFTLIPRVIFQMVRLSLPPPVSPNDSTQKLRSSTSSLDLGHQMMQLQEFPWLLPYPRGFHTPDWQQQKLAGCKEST